MFSAASKRAASYGRLSVIFAALVAVAPPAGALSLWMSEDAVRAELIGPRLEGIYSDGSPWEEIYFPDRSIEYSDSRNFWKGEWSFRGASFCTFYNDGSNGGCWQVLKISRNCYKFYAAGRSAKPPVLPPGARRSSTARGWRKAEPSTCEPSVGV